MSYELTSLLKDMTDNEMDPNEEIYSYLSKTDTEKLAFWLTRLSRVRDIKVQGKKNAGRKSNLIGRIFERLIRVLLDGCSAITHNGNIRTTVSEIDFRITIQPLATVIPMLRDAGTHAIGEAKCVTKGLKGEWLHELSGILTTHSSKLAILFTACPPKKVRSDHRSIINILNIGSGHRIIPFGITQLEKIAAGENFLKLLNDQHVCCVTHSNDLAI